MTSRFLLAALWFSWFSPVSYADRLQDPAPSANRRRAPSEAPAVIAPMPARPPVPAGPPPVPVEVARLGKQLAGTYTCKGNQATPSGASRPLEATLVIKLDLDNAWLHASWVGKTSKLADYSTYDAVAHQWTRIQLRNDGGHALLTSLGEKGGEWVWEGPAVSATGTIQERHHEQSNGKELKLWGEAQLGGTWQKSYEASCKR
ncbi:hypothetical protein BH11MYX1_BH11MYX1_25480 [soil metagenome]